MSYRQYYANLNRRRLIYDYLLSVYGDMLTFWRPIRGKQAPLLNPPIHLEIEYHKSSPLLNIPVYTTERITIDIPLSIHSRPERKDMDDPYDTIAYEDDKECSFCGRKLSLYEEIQFHPVKRWAKCKSCVAVEREAQPELPLVFV